MTDLLAELRAIGLLRGLDDAVLQRIAAVTVTESLQPGQALMTQGATDTDLFVVRSGRLDATVQTHASTMAIARLGPGDVIGEARVIIGGLHTATVTAIEPAVVLRLPGTAFDALVMESAALRNALIDTLRQRRHAETLRRALLQTVGHDPALLDALCAGVTWVHLPRGARVWEQGATVGIWHVLVSGELHIVAERHGGHRTVGQVRVGEAFGEIAMLRAYPRPAGVLAARESWLARFDKHRLGDAALAHNATARALLDALADRLVAPSRPVLAPAPAPIVAVLPRDTELDRDGFVAALSAALDRYEPRRRRSLVVTPQLLRSEGVIGDVAQLPPAHPGWLRLQGWLDAQRLEWDILLLVADGGDTPWSRMALAQADRVLLLADADRDPRRSAMEQQMLSQHDGAQAAPVWLVLVHPAQRTLPHGTAAWLDARRLAHHAHVRHGHAADIDRLARWLAGATHGIAL